MRSNSLPTEHQRQAAAAKYAHQSVASVSPVGAPSDQSARPPAKSLTFGQRFSRWFSLLCVLTFVFSLLKAGHGNPFASMENAPESAYTWVTIGAGALIVLGTYWLWVFLIRWIRFTTGMVGEAAKPIPSLHEIDAQLRAEGYEPTLQDLLLVEQRLKSERNESAVLAGGSLIAMRSAARQANGKPFL